MHTASAKDLSRPTWRERRAPALWRRGEIQLDRLAAGTRARLDGEFSGVGLENQCRDLLGAVDADPGAEHPAARAVATRLVRCQSGGLAHHTSTLAAAWRAVNPTTRRTDVPARPLGGPGPNDRSCSSCIGSAAARIHSCAPPRHPCASSPTPYRRFWPQQRRQSMVFADPFTAAPPAAGCALVRDRLRGWACETRTQKCRRKISL